MAGKNPLWVAKQHGHSIATMLRAYAAWAEGTAEVDVEAIKRSMNASEAPPTRNLAVNLSVAEALRTKSAVTNRPARFPGSCANRLFRQGKVPANSTENELAGVAGFEPTNGGIKTAIIIGRINKLLTILTEIFPSSPFDSPSLPPNLPPARAHYDAAGFFGTGPKAGTLDLIA
jgi:hypothetical protein